VLTPVNGDDKKFNLDKKLKLPTFKDNSVMAPEDQLIHLRVEAVKKRYLKTQAEQAAAFSIIEDTIEVPAWTAFIEAESSKVGGQ